MRGDIGSKHLYGRCFTIMLILILFLSTINLGALADSLTPKSSIQNTLDDDEVFISIPPIIQLKAATFDPLSGFPEIPEDLTYNAENGYYLVQCQGPIQPEWYLELEEKGAKLLGYIPNFTYILYIESHNIHTIKNLPFVRWVGNYEPAYKIQNGLKGQLGEVELRVLVFNEVHENIKMVRDALEDLGGEITSDGEVNSIIRVIIDAGMIPDIAFIPQIEWIDLYSPPQSQMNIIRAYTGALVAEINGFDGTGIIGEVKDSGIDLDHPDFIGQILATDGTIIDDPHGTPVFGIVFSTGQGDSDATGMMPGGQGVFASWDVLPTTSISNLVNNWGGVFQSNSWSTGDTDSNYTTSSYEHDEGVFDYDISIFHSAGNSGVAPYTCTQESVAKNVIAVGGVFHLNTQSRGDDTWSDFGPGSTPAQGPAADGRFKPDLCGPFDSIYTTDSVDGDGEDGYDTGDYTSDFGGTSGATPVAAGAGGLIYQMYKENHFGNNPTNEIPHASTIKAILIADAYQYDFAKAQRRQQGWGVVDVDNVYSIGEDHFIENEPISIKTGESQSFYVTPTQNGPMKISLVWTDVPASPGANPALVNDLHLKVTDPSNTVYWGNFGLDSAKWSTSGGSADNINNVENVFIQNPADGTWGIEIIGANVPFEADSSTVGPDQPYSLVVSNAIGRLAINITDPADSEWVKGTVSIAGISRGPVTSVEVKIDGGSWEVASGTIDWSYMWDTQLVSDGTHTISARAFNGTDYSDVDSITLHVDNTKPSTTLSVGSPNYDNGSWWFVIDTTPFTLIGNDGAGSGIAENKYRILYNKVQVVPWTPGSSFMLSWGEGEYIIQYYSVDNMGNEEDFHTAYVLVDMSPPQTTLNVNEPRHRGAPTDDWNVSIQTTFDLSPALDDTGIAYQWYMINGKYSEGGSFNLLGYSEKWHYIQWGSCDHLGYNESGNSDWVYLDRSSPTVDIIEGSPQFREYGFNWLNVTNETTFTLDSSDPISGVDFDWYSIDGDFYYGSVFTLDGYENGTYSVIFGSQDNVANNRSVGPYIYNLDLDPPITVLELGDPSFRTGENNPWNVTKSTDFDLWPVDEYSGVLITWYKIDGNYFEAPFHQHIRFNLGSLSDDGAHTIEWGSTDNLGQEEPQNSLTVILDSQGPQTELLVGEPRYRDSIMDLWNVTTETEFTLNSSDEYSGVNLIWYEIDGDYFEGSVFNLSGRSQGFHTIKWGASDNLGNLEAENTQVVYLSINPSKTTLDILGEKFRDSSDHMYNITNETLFRLAPPDIHPGVDILWYTINGNYYQGDEFDLSGYEEGLYTITWGYSDSLGTNETGNMEFVYLDTKAPSADLVIGEPRYRELDSEPFSVNAETELRIISIDNGSGVDHDWYTIDGTFKKGSSFTLSGLSEGLHTITWGSVDNLGHDEQRGTISINLDMDSPEISIHIGEPSLIVDDVIYLTTSTEISFNYRDSGVNQTTVYYSLDGGSHFEIYESPFTVPRRTTSIIFGGQDVLENMAGDEELEPLR
jgi:hypothetical protein